MSTTPVRTDTQRAVITGYGAITPIGGVLLVVGWVLLALGRRNEAPAA